MKRALIIGSSGGIGAAMNSALQTKGLEVTGLSRRDDGLDVTDEASVQRALGGLQGPYDLIFVATGALEIGGAAPEKSIANMSLEAMRDQFLLNAVGPMLVMKHARRLLPRNAPSTLAVLSARVGSIGDNRLGGWHSYRAAKAALNQFVHGAAIEFARSHKHLVCVALHPGTVATPFTEKYLGRHPAVQPAEAAENLIKVIESLTPEDSGKFFDYARREIPW